MGEYRRDSKGTVTRTQPRKFRRGRIRWVDGKMDVSRQHFKFWTL